MHRPKYYVPKNPYPTPPFYPQAPVGILETPAHFAKYDVDTLFYIFYYQVGTYMQCVSCWALRLANGVQVLGRGRAEAEGVALPQAVPHLVPAGERAAGHHRGVRAGRLVSLSLVAYAVLTRGSLYFDWETAWSTRRKNSL
jgi:hypothetical protein